MNIAAQLTAMDFASAEEVRWCPGCGDYAILKAVRQVLAEIGRPPHEVVFVSGIGCAARFPYYLSTYGFHTIHGRATAVATGVKLANPGLDVWVVGGDGDFLSIGGNHLMHVLRRDVDLNLLLFNNAIYGLTKGQYSPTSPIGTRSPSSPTGSVEPPVNALRFALGAGATFIARSVDAQQDHLPGVLARAHAHRGASLVEILQNCIIYHDGAFGPISEKAHAAEASVRVVHGEQMRFGKDGELGLVLDAETSRFRVARPGVDCAAGEIARHDETDLMRAMALAMLGERQGEPTAIGVLYQREPNGAPALRDLGKVAPMRRETLSRLLAAAS